MVSRTQFGSHTFRILQLVRSLRSSRRVVEASDDYSKNLHFRDWCNGSTKDSDYRECRNYPRFSRVFLCFDYCQRRKKRGASSRESSRRLLLGIPTKQGTASGPRQMSSVDRTYPARELVRLTVRFTAGTKWGPAPNFLGPKTCGTSHRFTARPPSSRLAAGNASPSISPVRPCRPAWREP